MRGLPKEGETRGRTRASLVQAPPSRKWQSPLAGPACALTSPQRAAFPERAARSSRHLSPRVVASPPCGLPPHAKPDSRAAAALSAKERSMSLVNFFLPRSIARCGFLLAARFPRIHWAAGSARAALFPASSCDHRPLDRIRRFPRNPDRRQSLLATSEFRRDPTKSYAPEKSPFRGQQKSLARSTSSACARVPWRRRKNRHTAPRRSPSTSRGTARIAASEGASKKRNSGESSASPPLRKAAAAHATASLPGLFLFREPLLCALQSPRSPSTPGAELRRSKRSN